MKRGYKAFTKLKNKPLTQPVQQTFFAEPEQPQADQTEIVVLTRDFNGHKIRFVVIQGEVWCILSDVAAILGFRDAPNAGRYLRPQHTTTPSGSSLSIQGLRSNTTLISQAGLNRLLMRSDKPEAEPFQDWITDEVLPSIQKTGSYNAGPSGQVKRTMRRNHCDEPTAVARVKNRELNRRMHGDMFSLGQGSWHIAGMHNGLYRGQFGKEAPELRAMVGAKPHETPLDYFSESAVSSKSHAQIMAEKRIREDGIPPSEQPKIFEEYATKLAIEDRARFETPHSYQQVQRPGGRTVIDFLPDLTLSAPKAIDVQGEMVQAE